MKRNIFAILSFWMVAGFCAASPFISGKRYRLVSAHYGRGSVVTGQVHQVLPLVYYDEQADEHTADAWWTVEKSGDNYTFCNAQTKDYLYYDKVRDEQRAKGLRLRPAPKDDADKWRMTVEDGAWVITNVAAPEQCFDVRTNGTFLVGTYAQYAAPSENQRFYLFDEEGERVEDVQSDEAQRNSFSSWVSSLRFENKDLVYRKDNHSYMFHLRDHYMGAIHYVANVSVNFRETKQDLSLRIDGKELSADQTFNFGPVSGLQQHRLQIYQGNELKAEAPLQFTFLPIVEINVYGTNGSEYTDGSIRVNDFESKGYDSTYVAAFRYRGATAQSKQKKSYAVKLKDSQGNSVDRKFLGLRNDNNWILDAAAVDSSMIRNRLSTDLWNAFAHRPYYASKEKKAKSGTDGKFVEVLLNGRYQGLYCMTEKLDRKAMKLKKLKDNQVHGALYKSSTWSYEVFFGHQPDDTDYSFPNAAPRHYNDEEALLHRDENWAGYEVKYPDVEDGEPITWQPLWDAINFTATANDEQFKQDFETYFDKPVLKDYYLLIELLLATDNHGKNMFYALYDREHAEWNKKLTIGVWDLDGTWGGRWDGSYAITAPQQNFRTFLDQHEHGQLSYYYRLFQLRSMRWQDELQARYAALRQGEWDVERIQARMEDYKRRFVESGADLREQARWPQYHKNIAKAIDYMKEWVKQRMAYLDKWYHYTPISTGIAQVTDGQECGVYGGKGSLSVHLQYAQPIIVYNVMGQVVRKVDLPEGLSRVQDLLPGVYVVKGHKVMVQ